MAARRLWRFWVRWSSWHWAPRGHAPLRAKSGHSSVCFFLHCREKVCRWVGRLEAVALHGEGKESRARPPEYPRGPIGSVQVLGPKASSWKAEATSPERFHLGPHPPTRGPQPTAGPGHRLRAGRGWASVGTPRACGQAMAQGSAHPLPLPDPSQPILAAQREPGKVGVARDLGVLGWAGRGWGRSAKARLHWVRAGLGTRSLAPVTVLIIPTGQGVCQPAGALGSNMAPALLPGPQGNTKRLPKAPAAQPGLWSRAPSLPFLCPPLPGSALQPSCLPASCPRPFREGMPSPSPCRAHCMGHPNCSSWD